MDLNLPHTKMKVNVHVTGERFTYEGDASMSQAQIDYYQNLIGDGKARVSVSRDESEKDFGNGGGVGVTVTLTCGQTHDQIQGAVGLAFQVADNAVRHYGVQIKQDLINRGILKP